MGHVGDIMLAQEVHLVVIKVILVITGRHFCTDVVLDGLLVLSSEL